MSRERKQCLTSAKAEPRISEVKLKTAPKPDFKTHSPVSDSVEFPDDIEDEASPSNFSHERGNLMENSISNGRIRFGNKISSVHYDREAQNYIS